MTYRLVTNDVDPTNVEERDDRFILHDVPFIKPMELSGGYIPRWSIKQTMNAWRGVPPTLNHPRDEAGQPIAANEKPELHLGETTDAEWDGDFGRATLEVLKEDLERLGGEAADTREALENGDPIEVSSQYRAAALPPGEYDGEYRENVERIVEPDSIAILPNKSGVCSIEDGCGIKPQLAANADITVPMQANVEYELTDVTPDAVSEYTDAEWDGSDVIAGLPNPSESKDAPEVLDETHLLTPTGDEARESKSNWKLPFRESADSPVNTRALVAIDAALSGARGGVDGVSSDTKERAQELTQAFLADAPDDLFGAVEAESNSVVQDVVNFVAEKVGATANEAGGNSGADDDTSHTMEDDDKIDFIASNSEYDRENLEAWDGTDCLDRLYQDVQANTESDGDDGGAADDGGSADGEVVMTENDLEELIEEKATQIVENREQRSAKEQLVDDIVANSAEYDADDRDELLETPETVLETLRDKATTNGSAIPGSGVSANVGGETDVSDFPSPIASERAKELEADD